MVQLFISQPMRGRSDEEIAAEREYAKLAAERILKEEVEVIDSFFQDGDGKPLEYLGDSLKILLPAGNFNRFKHDGACAAFNHTVINSFHKRSERA